MSRNGNGQYTLPAGNPVVTGTTITSDWANTTLGDIATALTGSVASDGQTPMSGTLDMSNNKVTGLANGTNPTDAVTVGQISNPNITSGTINGCPIGQNDPKDGNFLALTANNGAFSTSLTAPTVLPPTDSTTKVATTAFVQAAIGAVSAGVTSFNTRSGAVTLESADVVTALGFTPYNAGTSTVVTTDNIGTYTVSKTGTGASGTWGISINGNAASANTANAVDSITSNQVSTALGYVPVNPVNATLTGTPTAPTASIGTNTTQIATTAFVLANQGGGGGAVTSVNGKTGVVTLNFNDVGAYAATNPSNFTTLAAVAGQGYTTLAAVQAQGYTTLATVQQQGYLTSSSGVTLNTTQAISGQKSFSTTQETVFAGSVRVGASTNCVHTNNGLQWNGTGYGIAYYNNAGNIISPSSSFIFQNDKSCINAKATSTWDVPSDIRIKQNIKSVDDALSKLNQLNPVFYEYKDNPSLEKSGFVAQEYIKIFPEAECSINTPPDLLSFVNNEPQILGISIELNAYYVKAIQQLSAQITAMQVEINALKAK